MHKNCIECGNDPERVSKLLHYAKLYLGPLESEFNKPGGTAFDDFTIYREILELREIVAADEADESRST